MLTRLKVSGFKNLLDVDVRFGAFTCIAGQNGTGKSNLFDAILFLSHLADHTLLDAAQMVREPRGRPVDVRTLFFRSGALQSERMEFEAEMIIPRAGFDDLGQKAEASTTLVTYRLVLGLNPHHSFDGQPLFVLEEKLTHVTLGKAREHFFFRSQPGLLERLGVRRRTTNFISTDEEGKHVLVHQDTQSQGRHGNRGRARSFALRSLPRTVLSTAMAAESPTALLARKEMRSWRLLQLEPTAMRSPDPFVAPQTVHETGAHLPATYARLLGLTRRAMRSNPNEVRQTVLEKNARQVRKQVVGSLGNLIEGIRDVTVDQDDKRELFSLRVIDGHGTPFEARSLSDGTLRFLALSLIAFDPEAAGLICMEEPENGIHPGRTSAMLKLLREMAYSPALGEEGHLGLRQLIVNTHSPGVVGLLPADDILFAKQIQVHENGHELTRTIFLPIQGTWRSVEEGCFMVVDKGEVIEYLSPLQEALIENPNGNTAGFVGLEAALPWVELGTDA